MESDSRSQGNKTTKPADLPLEKPREQAGRWQPDILKLQGDRREVYVFSSSVEEGGEVCWEERGRGAGEEKELGFSQPKMAFSEVEPRSPGAGWHRAVILQRKG